MGKLDGALYSGLRQILSGNGEREMNASEDLGVGLSTVCIQRYLTTRDLMTPAPQDEHDIVGRAAACAGQQHFHGTRGQVVAASFGSTVHGGHVAAASACNEEHAFRAAPVNGALHIFVPDRWT